MLISIIMAVYNGDSGVANAIESILNQTFKDFEFIIVDDGSSDNSYNIIKNYASRDNRIKIIRNLVNTGLTKSLNKAILSSKGKYIARQDDDDISRPKRLEYQIKFLEENPDYAFCGCNGIIKQNRAELLNFFNLEEIKKNLIKANCFAHPSILIRRNVLEKYGLYDEKLIYGQDFELWCRLIYKYRLKTINLKNKLIILDNPINKLKEKSKQKTFHQSKNQIITTIKYLKYSKNKIGGLHSILKLIINIFYITFFTKNRTK